MGFMYKSGPSRSPNRAEQLGTRNQTSEDRQNGKRPTAIESQRRTGHRYRCRSACAAVELDADGGDASLALGNAERETLAAYGVETLQKRVDIDVSPLRV